MPFDLTSPQDVWGYIQALKNRFNARETLLAQCEAVLSVLPTDWFPERDMVQYEGVKGMLQVQQQRATVLVAQDFHIRLPVKPDMTQQALHRLENTEMLLGGAVDLLRQQARLRQLRRPEYDLAALAVERGATAAYWYWKEGLRGWQPCLEVYDPRYVYYESDPDGLVWAAAGFTLPEAELAGLVQGEQGWHGVYDTNARGLKNWYFVWHRPRGGNEVLWGVVGPGSKATDAAQNLVELHPDPQHRWIPLVYIPAGGPAVRLSGGSSGLGTSESRTTPYEQQYGQPLVASMLADADAANFFTRLYLAAGLLAAHPPIVYSDPSRNPKTPELTPGQIMRTPPGSTTTVLNAVNPSVLPVLGGQIAALIGQIEQKGLGGAPTGQPTLPRSELLRQGLQESIAQMAMPYVDCYESMWVQGLTLLRDQASTLMQSGKMGAINLEVVPKRQYLSAPKRERRSFKREDLEWDGAIDIILRPKQTRESIIEGYQVFNLMHQAEPRIPVTTLLEEVLGFEQPEHLLRQGEEELINAQLAPAKVLLTLEHRRARLRALRRPVEGSEYIADVSPQDEDLLAPLLKEFDLPHQEEGYLVSDIDTLIAALTFKIENLRPQVMLPPQQPSGGAPAARPTVTPAQLPSQADQSNNGARGGQGTVEELARQITAQSGSDQNGRGP